MPARPARLRPPLPPQQERSERTLEALARAAEDLLARKDWSDIGIQELCRKAGCTTGAFYARFRAKDELLPFLYARYDAGLEQRVLPLFRAAVKQATDLRDLAERATALMVREYRARRWLLRAVALYARAHPRDLDPEVLERRRGLHEELARAFLRFRDRITHPDPVAAVRTALFVGAAVAREKILFNAPHAAATPLDDESLVAELSRMLRAYLTS